MTTQEAINLARQRHEEGQHAEAEALYQDVLKTDSNNAECHFRLGRLMADMGKLDEAVAAFRQAAALRPDVPQAQFNLGVALDQKREFAQAINSYQRALALRPDDHAAVNNLGAALCRLRQWDQAIATLQLAVRLAPAAPQSHMNLGNAFLGGGDHDRAIESFNRALALQGDYADAWNNLANAYKGCGQPAKAIECYEKVLSLRPNFAAADSNRLSALYLDPAQDSRSILVQHQAWDRRHAEPLRHLIVPAEKRSTAGRRIRIGYVSADFCNHVVGRHLLPLLKNHDREQFEIFCYSNVQRPDAFSAQLKAHADGWRDICDVPDDAAAELIRGDKIDILVDLSLHSPGNRMLLFARKPARVQATFMGYPGGTGLSAMDWRITDPYLDPVDQSDGDYVERSYRLADSFWCYRPEAAEAEPTALPALTNGWVTFGCLNNFSKINEVILELWARALEATPQSRLRLRAPGGSPRQRLLETFNRRGVGSDRVEFVATQSHALYLLEYSRIDIGLDTLPYNGHTTSLDAMWMGVPVVTRVGRTVVGRGGWSQLSNLKLTELAGHDDEQFVKIAADLAGDLARLSELRRTLRQRMGESPLTDGVRFAQNVEGGYREFMNRDS